MCNIYLNNSVIGLFVPVHTANRGRPLTPAGHKRRMEAQAKKEAKATQQAEKAKRTQATAERKAATAKRRETVFKHLQKNYQGKTFTVKDVQKSLALALRNWQVGSIAAELNVSIQEAGAKIVDRVCRGRGRPANVYSFNATL